jgi:hypothetical protein
MKTEQAYIAEMKAARTLASLKSIYHAAAIEYHPDLHPGLDHMIMGRINNVYDSMTKTLARTNDWNEPATETQYAKAVKVAEEYKAIIIQLLKMEGLIIEICGSWLWVSGETQRHKAALAKIGLKWSSNKSMWYWRPPEYKSYNRKQWDIARIRSTFGARNIDSLDDDSAKPVKRPA